MAKTVFIFGAGASAKSGAPVMATFLKAAEDLYYSGTLGQEQVHFDRVFKALVGLRQVHSKARLDTDNIEEIYTAFEMGKLLQKLPGTDIEKIDELIASLQRVIALTIERTQKFKSTGGHKVPEPYEKLAPILQSLRANKEAKPYALLTFNYDLALESLCAMENTKYDYCLNGECEAGKVPLLKLHGSLNWHANGAEIQCVDFKDLNPFWPAGQESQYLSVLPCLSLKRADSTPFIVPPALAKTEGQAKIGKVWRVAAQELSEAERIVVIGYSIPSTDTFFRHLFALGTVGDRSLRTAVMVNNDGPAQARFKQLLAESPRASAKPVEITFEHALNNNALLNAMGLNAQSS